MIAEVVREPPAAGLALCVRAPVFWSTRAADRSKLFAGMSGWGGGDELANGTRLVISGSRGVEGGGSPVPGIRWW